MISLLLLNLIFWTLLVGYNAFEYYQFVTGFYKKKENKINSECAKIFNFTIWTKNPDIIDNVFKQGYTKPKNLRIILSSPVINVLTDYIKIYSWCDSVFTVYTKEYASTHNIVINCGGRSCATCTGGRCYFKGGCHPVYINELLK